MMRELKVAAPFGTPASTVAAAQIPMMRELKVVFISESV